MNQHDWELAARIAEDGVSDAEGGHWRLARLAVSRLDHAIQRGEQDASRGQRVRLAVLQLLRNRILDVEASIGLLASAQSGRGK